MKNKILIIANSYEFLFQYKFGLTKQFLKKGHNVIWIYPSSKKNNQKIEGVNLIQINGKRSSIITIMKLFLISLFIKIFNKNVIIISHTLVCNITTFLVALITKSIKVYLVVTGFGPSRIRNSLFYRMVGRIYLAILRKSSKNKGIQVQVLNINDKILVQDYNSQRKVNQIQESGVTLQDLEEGEKGMAKKFINIQRKKLKVGFLGRFLLEKGIEDFRIMVNLLNKLDVDFDFVIAGNIDPQNSSSISIEPFFNDLKNVRIEINTDYRKFFSEIDILIFPSYREGQPKYLIRSMAFGVVVIAYPSAGLSSIIIDNFNGILTKHKTPSDLASNLLTLNNNRNELENISNKAFDYIKSLDQDTLDLNLANSYLSN